MTRTSRDPDEEAFAGSALSITTHAVGQPLLWLGIYLYQSAGASNELSPEFTFPGSCTALTYLASAFQ